MFRTEIYLCCIQTTESTIMHFSLPMTDWSLMRIALRTFSGMPIFPTGPSFSKQPGRKEGAASVCGENVPGTA